MIRGLARARPGGLSTRSRTFAVYALLLAANFAAWAWAFSAFHAYPILLGTAALAYSFGLRHAFDADHIAAIDNVTRKLMQAGPAAGRRSASISRSAIRPSSSACRSPSR